jgi:ferritin-like metal-binding protein YciE
MHTLQHLLVHEVQDLYDAEKQLIEALPKMAEKAAHPQLKAAFQNHLRETEQQVRRLEQIASLLAVEPDEVTCKAMKGLIKEGEEMIREGKDPAVTDAGLIGAAQKVEHYEMAGYGTARAHAQNLGLTEVARLLQQSLDEESGANEKLNRLAVGTINQYARVAHAAA